MDERDDQKPDALICVVCGLAIADDEPAVQAEDGSVSHVRCAQRDQTLRGKSRRRVAQ
jgi:hypothetical protein